MILALAARRVPRLLLVSWDAPAPTGTDCEEDWIRMPATDADIAARRRVVCRVACARHARDPHIDAHHRLHASGGWSCTSSRRSIGGCWPTSLERMPEPSAYDELIDVGWTGEGATLNALRVARGAREPADRRARPADPEPSRRRVRSSMTASGQRRRDVVAPLQPPHQQADADEGQQARRRRRSALPSRVVRPRTAARRTRRRAAQMSARPRPDPWRGSISTGCSTHVVTLSRHSDDETNRLHSRHLGGTPSS